MGVTRRSAFLLTIGLIGIVVAATADTRLALDDYFTLISPTVLDRDFPSRWTSPPFTADLNGDGNDDLVALGLLYSCCGETSPMRQPGRVFLGDGNGNFTAAAPTEFPVDTLKMVNPRKVLFGDLNGDGRLDMFIACHGWDTDPYPGEQNRLYLSQRGGGWRDATDTLPQLSDYSHTAAIGDLSARGTMDIVVGNYFGAQNRVLSYALLNNGGGQFTMTRAILPVGPGQTMDANSGHYLLGATLTDLNGDGLPELIVTGDATDATKKLPRTTILWNRAGAFSDTDKTELPAPSPFPTHIDLDAQSIDLNGDGLRDLVIVGSQGQPFYDGWFVQLLLNIGNRTFVDVTASRLPVGDVSGGIPGVAMGAPWPYWVKVLDFNADGFSDFSVEYFAGAGLPSSQPVIYLNDGTGHFSTLMVRDFVTPGNESVLGGAHLMPTRNGYSFMTLQVPPFLPRQGLVLTGLLATKPYRVRPIPSGPPSQLSSGASIDSANGQYRLTYQLDGNLVVFDARPNVAVWATNTAGTTPGRLTMQSDGNLVLYDGAGVPRWASNTGGNPGAYFVLQNDGNLVIYSASDQVLWDRFR